MDMEPCAAELGRAAATAIFGALLAHPAGGFSSYGTFYKLSDHLGSVPGRSLLLNPSQNFDWNICMGPVEGEKLRCRAAT